MYDVGDHQTSDAIRGREWMDRNKDKWKKLYFIENFMDLLEGFLEFFFKH